MTITRIRLMRTGQPSLAFNGAVVAKHSNRGEKGPSSVRWHEVDLYRKEDGSYVVHILYRSKWRGERGLEEAFELQTIDGVESVLQEYDPVVYVQGYPPLPQYKEQQERLLSAIKLNWGWLCSKVMAESVFTGEEVEQ